jgi:hypothetical protein
MNRLNFDRRIVALAAILATAFSATSAVANPIVTITDFAVPGGSNDAGINFAVGYAANTPTGATWSDDPTVPSGNLGQSYSSPFSSNSLTATTSYFAVNKDATFANPAPAAPSPVTLSWTSDQSGTFSILWGSIDAFNTITFKDGTNTVFTYTGTQLINQLNLAPHFAGANTNTLLYNRTALVNFTFSSGLVFDKIEFKSEYLGSDANAFEFALAPIPAPSTALLFLTALGCLSFAKRARASV